jgi:uncharacterized RDD family membrane protein YckC
MTQNDPSQQNPSPQDPWTSPAQPPQNPQSPMYPNGSADQQTQPGWSAGSAQPAGQSPYGASPAGGAYPSPDPQQGYAGAPQPGGAPYASPGGAPYASPNPQQGYPGVQPGVAQGAPQQAFVNVNTVAGPVTDYIEIPGQGVVKLATIGQRALARILDSVIVGAGIGIIMTIVTVISTAIAAGSSTGTDEELAAGVFSGVGLFIGVAVVSVLVIYAYEAVMIGFWGATLGKMIMKVKVVKPRNGAVPGIGAGLVRYLIPGVVAFLFGLIPFVGVFLGEIGAIICFLSATFDSSGRRQGWHDKIAGTVVVSKSA